MLSVARSEIGGAVAESLPAPPSRITLAWRDLAGGLAKSWMWSALALQDIKLRYRGSVLGPFWLTITTLVMVLTMGVLYPHLFNMPIRNYLPYLAIGLVMWQFIAGLISDGCDTFVRAESVIQQIPIPFSVHAYQMVCRQLLIFAHSFVLIPIGLLALRRPVGWEVLEIVPAVAVLTLDGLWIGLLLGMMSARFRDIPPIVVSFLQVAFFLTPVIWPIDALGWWRPLASLNPLFAALDVVRAPLLNQPCGEYSWLILLSCTVLGCAATFFVFARFRTRIAYWI